MAKPTPWKDEYTLLCEKCGYVLEGLDQAGVCPECGKPIEESLPQRRVGTPWQQKPGVKSLVRTWWMTLRHPKRTLDVMRISQSDGVMHTLLTLISTYFLGLAIASIPYVFTGIYNFLGILILMIGIGTFALVAGLVLVAIESRGLRFFGRSKGNRIDDVLAWAIVGHGAVGWAIVGIGLGISLLLYFYYPSQDASVTDWIEKGQRINMIAHRVALSSFLVGFLFFEFFAYLGLRRCKYANRVRPEESDPGATTRP